MPLLENIKKGGPNNKDFNLVPSYSYVFTRNEEIICRQKKKIRQEEEMETWTSRTMTLETNYIRMHQGTTGLIHLSRYRKHIKLPQSLCSCTTI